MNTIFKNAAALTARLALAAGITSVIFAAAVAPAMAQVPDTRDQVSRLVSTSGLDLAKDEDRSALSHRVWLAARRACTAEGQPSVDEASSQAACTADAFAQAMGQVRQMLAERALARSYAQASK